MQLQSNNYIFSYQSYFTNRCEYGVINNVYPASELEDYTGKLSVPIDDWDKEPRVSLREASLSQSAGNVFTSNFCRCTGGCATKRCRCIRNGISCSSHCHSSKPCFNKKDSQLKDGNIA